MLTDHLDEIGVKELKGDVISVSEHSAAKNDIPSLTTIEKSLLTLKRLKIDGRCLWSRERKARSFYRLMTSFPLSNTPQLPKSTFRHFGISKMRVAWYLLDEKCVFSSVVALSNSDLLLVCQQSENCSETYYSH